MKLLKILPILLAVAAFSCVNAKSHYAHHQKLPVHIPIHHHESNPDSKKERGGPLSRWLEDRGPLAYFFVGFLQCKVGLAACWPGFAVTGVSLFKCTNHRAGLVPLVGVAAGAGIIYFGVANTVYGIQKMWHGVFGKKEDKIIYVYAQHPEETAEVEEISENLGSPEEESDNL